MVDTDAQVIAGLPVALAATLECAAAALARLDSLLREHKLVRAWAYRAQLDAIRRQAAVDGRAIDEWDLAALIEGVRLRLDRAPPGLERGALFEAARHAFLLEKWYTHPSPAQRQEIAAATAHLASFAERSSPLLGAALAVHAWLGQGGPRPPLRAALSSYWYERGLTPLPCPALTGVAAFAGETPSSQVEWIGAFLAAIAAEAANGVTLLRAIERQWYAARAAVAGRRRDSHASAAVDLLAAAPLLSATSLARVLGIAIKTATQLLDSLVRLGIAVELTHRAKRRLYGLKYLAPLLEAAAPPRRPLPGRWPGRPLAAELAEVDSGQLAVAMPPLPPPLRVSPPSLPEFDFNGLDRLLDETDRAIRRAERALEEFGGAVHGGPTSGIGDQS